MFTNFEESLIKAACSPRGRSFINAIVVAMIIGFVMLVTTPPSGLVARSQRIATGIHLM